MSTVFEFTEELDEINNQIKVLANKYGIKEGITIKLLNGDVHAYIDCDQFTNEHTSLSP